MTNIKRRKSPYITCGNIGWVGVTSETGCQRYDEFPPSIIPPITTQNFGSGHYVLNHTGQLNY